jgi:hypothetical protein
MGKPISLSISCSTAAAWAGKTLGPALIRYTPSQTVQELEASSSELGTHADISSNQEWVLGVGVLQSSSKRSDLRIVGAVCSRIIPPSR